MKINLIFLCANFEKGGAGNSIIRLCQKLNKKKYIISIICLNKFSYFFSYYSKKHTLLYKKLAKIFNINLGVLLH